MVGNFRIEQLSAVFLSAICGILTADFGSGMVHWAADTWGSIELPVIGKVIAAHERELKASTLKTFSHSSFKNFLRPFREHHIDPTSITRHDFIETNGDNFMVALPILGKLAWIFFRSSPTELEVAYPFCAYLFLCSIFVAITNQACRPFATCFLSFFLTC